MRRALFRAGLGDGDGKQGLAPEEKYASGAWHVVLIECTTDAKSIDIFDV